MNGIFQLVQFTDAKRFLASIGIILVCLSVLLPWLVLSQPLSVDVKAAEVGELTTLGQYDVVLRQFMSLSLIVLSCCLSPVLFVVGATFATVSFWTWVIRGDKPDDKYDTDIIKVDAKIKMIEYRGLKDKAVKEALAKEDSLRSLFTSKMIDYFSKDQWEIELNKAVDHLWYDLVIRFPKSQTPDILIKVKYARSSLNTELVKLYFTSLIYAWNVYRAKHKRYARAIGIILHDRPPVYSFGDIVLFEKNPFSMLKLDVDFIRLSESELQAMDKDEFIKLLFSQSNFVLPDPIPA